MSILWLLETSLVDCLFDVAAKGLKKAKTLLIHGEQDPVLNVKNSYLMNELIPDSDLIVIPSMRHLIEEEILDQFKDKLKIHLTT